MLKIDNTLNFRPYDDGLGNTSFTGYDYANAVVNKVNQRLSTNEQMHLPQGNSTSVLERKYRLVLKGVYFHYDDNAFSCYDPSPGHMDETELSYYSINPNSEINVFFLYDDNPNWNGASGGSANGNNYVIMKALWQTYRDHLDQVNSVIWGASWDLLHETGHNLGLIHTMSTGDGTCNEYHDDHLSDTPTIHEILEMGYPYPCPSWGDESPNYSNNAMDYSGLVAMTPQQLGVIHYTLTHDMINFVEDDYCDINTNVQDCYITNNVDLIWENDRIMMSNLIIEDGSKLTLKDCWLHMPINAKIIIKQGGKLIVDGALITNKCGNIWQGIEVWGDSNEDQNPHNGVYHQGYLELKNGATIENAICAVELWHPNDWSSTGGIVHAYNAVFRNNAKSVHAINYIDHYASGNEIDYNSSFNKCSFIIDDDYIGTETFYKHVDLNRIKGMVFRGCDFSVSSNANGVSDYSAGIAAYGAGFYVIPYCEDHFHDPCPENMKRHNTFTNFHDGIYAVSNGDNARTFSVKYADFNHNKRGIYAEDTGYATILNSEFNIGKGNSCCYGVYATNITGFCIEENSFAPSQYALGDTYGIGIFNSGGVNDIYLNTFDGLTCGNLAYGVNYNVPGSVRPPAVKPGLTYSCNDNTSNDIDFYILKDNGIGEIATNQGSSATPSGNTFSGSQYHIYNGGDIINYYYNSNGTNETPTSAKLLNVNAYPTTNTNSCASHYNSGGVVRNAAEKAELAYIYKTSDNIHVRNMAAGDIVRSCLNEDTTNMAELRLWLGNMGELASDRIVVASYIQNGDFTSALALANTLPNKYDLQGDDLSDYNDYMTLLYLYKTLYNSNRTVRDMTTTELETVKNMAENGYGASQQMAKAILVEIGERAVETIICPDMPRTGRGINADNGNPNANDSELEIAVAPIPATTWVSIDYKLPCENSTAIMTIVNSLGVKVLHIELAGEQGTRTIDLRDMPAGVYSYIVRCGEYQNTGKLVITK
ncbi:MAG: hypothetical protein IKQ09_00485 [Bacteroidales bacterium]|nr:hypothetical protein [Bacteroidales bacterium]